MIVDSHCHLDLLQAKGCDLDLIISQATEFGVTHMQTICTNLDNFPNILSIAQKYKNVFASVGVHPSEVKNVCTSAELVKLSEDKKVIGLGETGLDYYYNNDIEQQKMQRESFIQHIEAARNLQIPVIVHTRSAENDTENILKEQLVRGIFPVLIHCFSADKIFAKKMLDLGAYISIAGIVTFKKAELLQDAAKYIPLDRMLVETDSPYLAPLPYRGKDNQPAYTKFVAEYIAELKGVSLSHVAEQTTKNFFNLFMKAIN